LEGLKVQFIQDKGRLTYDNVTENWKCVIPVVCENWKVYVVKHNYVN